MVSSPIEPSARAHSDLGVILAELGDDEASLRHLRKATELEPGLVKAQLNLANALARLGHFDEAITAYGRLIEADPTNAQAHLTLADLLVRRERIEEAFRRELAKDPARMRVAGMSEFMVAEITRRRSRTGAGRAGSLRCPCCGGTGRVRTPAAAALAALRDIRGVVAEQRPRRVEVTCAPAVADELERREDALNRIEERHSVAIDVVEDAALGQDNFEVKAHRD